MWIWSQSKGELYHNENFVSKGYSGKNRGMNNPSLQNAKGIGPIPRGLWKIGEVYNSPNVGPYAIKLDPMSGTNTMGRSSFRIHGDSIKRPGDASRGCIILPRMIRERIGKSTDKVLKVVE